MSTMTLKADNVGKKHICPVCGSKMHHESQTCLVCRKAGGQDITNAARAVKESLGVAQASAERQPEKLQARMGSFIAKVPVPKNAELNTQFGFYRIKWPVPKMGHVKVDVHGMTEDDLGKTIVGKIEVKRIPARENQVYVRVQVLRDTESDIALAIQPEKGDGTILKDCPHENFTWEVTLKNPKPGQYDTRILDVTIGAVPA